MSPIPLSGATVNYALCCDDVRIEDTGKLFFIGVYSTDIVLRVVPAQIALRFVVQCVTTNSPQRDMSFRVKAGEDVQFRSDLKRDPTAVGVPPGIGFFVPLLPAPLRLTQETMISLEVETESDIWESIFSMPVHVASDATVLVT